MLSSAAARVAPAALVRSHCRRTQLQCARALLRAARPRASHAPAARAVLHAQLEPKLAATDVAGWVLACDRVGEAVLVEGGGEQGKEAGLRRLREYLVGVGDLDEASKILSRKGTGLVHVSAPLCVSCIVVDG